MHDPNDNPFQVYKLTNAEYDSGCILSILQLKVLQNELAAIANNKVNLDYNPRNPLEFAQTEAFLKGQMSMISTILARSIETETILKTQAAQLGN